MFFEWSNWSYPRLLIIKLLATFSTPKKKNDDNNMLVIIKCGEVSVMQKWF